VTAVSATGSSGRGTRRAALPTVAGRAIRVRWPGRRGRNPGWWPEVGLAIPVLAAGWRRIAGRARRHAEAERAPGRHDFWGDEE
jgi:hypothetical protein